MPAALKKKKQSRSRFPAGVDTGSRIPGKLARVKPASAAGHRAISYIVLHTAEHAQFERQGADFHIQRFR